MPDRGARMINTHIAAALIGATLAGGGAWRIQNWRADAHEKEHIALHAEQERDLHALEQKRSSGVIAAQNVARAREAQLRADAAGSRDALGGLRTASEAALDAARVNHDACIDRALAFSIVLDQCAAGYRGLAEKTDRHASDIKTLIDAWPK